MNLILVTSMIALLGLSTEVFGAAMKSTSSDGSVRAKRSPQDPMCGPPNRPPCGPPMGPPPDMSDFTTPMSTSTAALAKRSADDPQSGGEQGQPSLSGLAGTMGNMAGTAAGMMPEMAGAVANEMGNMAHRAGEMMG
ncbi:unnamed protein product [Xylocopa violacea]|uniref:Uncharacterized protein n=1 Tax=Xylocopa violacea TaxID=135666 RepID=A0ABP1MZY7_XYLVO